MHPWFGGLVYNPGMCPDWETNQQPLSSKAGTQSTEPHQAELKAILETFIAYILYNTNF